jgi:CTP-dependent riboflavin kinase
MSYKAQPLTEERFAKAKELVARFEHSGLIPQRTHYYMVDLIAEVEQLRAQLNKGN